MTPYLDAVGAQRGWRFEVTGRRGQPGVALEYGSVRDPRTKQPSRFIAARLRVGPHAAFWTWVDDWWGQAAFVYAGHSEPTRVVPPISARLATEESAWIRWFHHQLCASERSPLYDGEWWIGDAAAWPLRQPRALRESLTAPGAAWFSDFEDRVVATRRVPPSDRRVGFWRKQLRAGARPPVLLFYISLTEGFAVLDGHARLAAATEEGVELPTVVLSPFHVRRYPPNTAAQAGIVAQADKIDWARATPAAVDAYNRALVRSFADPVDPYFRSRGWPLRGGWASWRAEIEAHIASLPPTQAEHADHLLPPD